MFDIVIEEKLENRGNIILKCVHYYIYTCIDNKSDCQDLFRFIAHETYAIFYDLYKTYILKLVILFYNWIMEHRKI